MMDYTKLVEDLRDIEKTMFALGTSQTNMNNVSINLAYDKKWGYTAADAAAAIEALQAEVKRLELDNEDYEYTLRERYDEPKRGDLVEVVRCKDCIHFTQSGWCDREFDWFPVDDMDFCSSAEKMEVKE